jgi:hypothetical protein
MERRAQIVLYRLMPPFRSKVAIHRITIGGFLDLVRSVAPKAAVAVLQSKNPLTDTDLIRACADADTVAYFADLIAMDQPVGFLRGWLHGRLSGFFARRNTEALLAGCRTVEGDGQWTRFLGCLTPGSGEGKKKKGGGLEQDIILLCSLGFGTYEQVRGMAMQDFLTLCDAVNLGSKYAQSLDPLSDPDCEASPTIGIPGLWQVY